MKEGSTGKFLREVVCKGCHCKVTEKEMITALGPDKGKPFVARYGCMCADDKLAKETKQNFAKAKVNKIRTVFDTNSLVNRDLRKANMENFETKSVNLYDAKQLAKRFLNEFNKENPENLLFYGPSQVGKSHLAYSIAQEVMKKGHSALFISFPKLLTKIKGTYKKDSEFSQEDIMNLMREVDLLVLDDLGAEKNEDSKNKAWSDSILWELLDDRLGLHNIYTSNLNDKGLNSFYDERTIKRLLKRTDKFVFQRWS